MADEVEVKEEKKRGNPNWRKVEGHTDKEVYFVSQKADLTIWIIPDDETVYPTGARRLIPNSGKKIEFLNHKFHTKDKEKIEFICNMDEFKCGTEIFPDPADPNGYWEAEGYFTRVDQKDIRVPTNKMQLLRSEAQKALQGVVGTAQIKTATGI